MGVAPVPASDTIQRNASTELYLSLLPPYKCFDPLCQRRILGKRGYKNIGTLKRPPPSFHSGIIVGYNCQYSPCTYSSVKGKACRTHMGENHG